MELRFAVQGGEEEKAVVALGNTLKGIKEFGYLWKLWGNWEKNAPLLAYDEGKLVGFHAATYSKRTGYVNTYYQAVAADCQGKGVGRILLGGVLNEAANRGQNRMKLKVLQGGSPGHRFWTSLGAKPFGKDAKHFLYDLDISNCRDVKSFMEWLKKPELHAPMADKALAAYRKRGVETI